MVDSSPCGPVARICSHCEQAMVNDSDPAFEKRRRGERWHGIDAPTEFLLTDCLPDLSQLRHSAQQGCDFCGFLRTLVLSDETADRLRCEYKTDLANLGSSEITIKIHYQWNWLDGQEHSTNDYLVVGVDFGSDIWCEYWNSLNAVEGFDAISNQLSLSKSLHQSYADTETVQWLKSCIANCEEGHKDHRYPNSMPKCDFLPDRLLDITDRKVCLVSRQSVNIGSSGGFPDYAALSYCWGTFEDAQVQLKTTHSSLSRRQAGIEMEDLMMVPALQDAIRMTRELEIPYLWIDSLCILQDDISDWERNSSSMDKVYGSAKVTLVAAASRSCREGFLKVKGQQLLLPVRSTTQPTIRGLIQLRFKFCFTRLVGTAHDSYADFKNTPLSRRGWTVQERLLSAKQIIFGPCNVHFRCPHRTQSRGGRLMKRVDLVLGEIRTKETRLLDSTWSKVVDEFSCITAQSFTNPSDILPAISGLAHYFNGRFQDEYCAGHWKKHLFTSLMWTRVNLRTIRKMTHLRIHRSPMPYLLPSWSYLCKGYLQQYHINYIDPTVRALNRTCFHIEHSSDQPEVECLDWERLPLRSDPMGALRSAKLKIRTRIMNLSDITDFAVIASQVQWPHQCSSEDPGKQRWTIVYKYDCGRQQDSFLNLILDYNSTKANVVLDVPGYKLVLLGSCSMRPLPLPDSEFGFGKSRVEHHYYSYAKYRYVYGLLVAKSWEDKEEWCRIGVFTPIEFEDFTLDNFMEHSEVESISIL